MFSEMQPIGFIRWLVKGSTWGLEMWSACLSCSVRQCSVVIHLVSKSVSFLGVRDFFQFLHINIRNVQYSSDCWIFIISWCFSWRPCLKEFFFSGMRRSHQIIWQMWEGDCCPTCSYKWCLVKKNGKRKKCASQRDNTGKIIDFPYLRN